MTLNVFGLYLIKSICNILILFLFKVDDKCVECINRTNKVIKQDVYSDNGMPYDEILQKIDYYIITKKLFLNKDINAKKIARQCKVKNGLINKTLKAKYHSTFSNYLKEKRIEHACVLLLESSNMTIDVIADASGFKTTRTFQRSFKDIKKVSPTKYRLLQRIKKT
ncbi:helix-turn-helix domain-containing protein [Parabacteroides sp.]